MSKYWVQLGSTLVIWGSLGGADGFFMGTKHTTPPTQLPMFNHKGKTYAKVGDQYVEYNDDEMYYDRHQTMKPEAQMDREDRKILNLEDHEGSLSNSKTRKEERYMAEKAWKEAKREEVDDVTKMPMYEGETYNQYGRMEYGKEPEMYGGKQLGGYDADEPHYGPPLNPYNYGGPHHPQYGGGGGPGGAEHPMHQDVEVPPILGGGLNKKWFANPLGDEMGFGGPANDVRPVNEDYVNYLKEPPRGILTIRPLSEEQQETPSRRTLRWETRVPGNKTTGIPSTATPTVDDEDLPYWKRNVSALDFEKYHGSGGDLNLMNYDRRRKVVRLNEERAAYALEMARKQEHPDFDWADPKKFSILTMTIPKTEMTTTTEFVPRADVIIPDYVCNFR